MGSASSSSDRATIDSCCLAAAVWFGSNASLIASSGIALGSVMHQTCAAPNDLSTVCTHPVRPIHVDTRGRPRRPPRRQSAPGLVGLPPAGGQHSGRLCSCGHHRDRVWARRAQRRAHPRLNRWVRGPESSNRCPDRHRTDASAGIPASAVGGHVPVVLQATQRGPRAGPRVDLCGRPADGSSPAGRRPGPRSQSRSRFRRHPGPV